MTTSTTLSGGIAAPSAPEKGSFPLDHLSECRAFARAYHQCLKASSGVTNGCRKQARAYLQCRMQRGLMAEDEWDALGLSKDSLTGDANSDRDSGGGDSGGGDALANAAETAAEAGTGGALRGEFVAGAKLAKRRKEQK